VPSALRGQTTSGMLQALLASGVPRMRATKATAALATSGPIAASYYFVRSPVSAGRNRKLIEPRFRPSTLAADGYTLEPTWLAGCSLRG